MGDFVLALPSLWELRQKLGANAQIDVMASPSNAEWSRILDWLNIIPIDHPRYLRPQQPPLPFLIKLAKRSIARRGKNYDVAVELSSTTHDWVGKVMMILAGAKRRCGAIGSFDWLLSEKHDTGTGHQTRILSRRFPEEWNISGFAKPENFIPHCYRHAPRDNAPILLSPWAGTDAKQWPFENWRQLAGELAPAEIEILAPPHTEERSGAICEGMPHANVIRTSSIAETLDILAKAKLVVAVDSSTAHFAWLTGTPLIELFSGTTELGRWSSLAQGDILFKKPPCSPCHLAVCPQSKNFCMTDISVAEVLEAVRKLSGSNLIGGR